VGLASRRKEPYEISARRGQHQPHQQAAQDFRATVAVRVILIGGLKLTVRPSRTMPEEKHVTRGFHTSATTPWSVPPAGEDLHQGERAGDRHPGGRNALSRLHRKVRLVT